MTETRESTTAKLCSFARAYHSNTGSQKIFDDYLAYDLMGKEEYEEIGQLIENDFESEHRSINYSFSSKRIIDKLNRYITPIPLSRIAFAENKLLEFADKHGKCQYVVCGAGMDTFAFRNGNPDIHVFELDHPNTGRYKRERVKQLEWNIPENLTFVPIDFSTDNMTQALFDAGFQSDVPSFFAILGVSYYLTLSVFAQTIGEISGLCTAESQIVFDYPDETTLSNTGAERVHTLAEITEKLFLPFMSSAPFMACFLEIIAFAGRNSKRPERVLRKLKHWRPPRRLKSFLRQESLRKSGRKASIFLLKNGVRYAASVCDKSLRAAGARFMRPSPCSAAGIPTGSGRSASTASAAASRSASTSTRRTITTSRRATSRAHRPPYRAPLPYPPL